MLERVMLVFSLVILIGGWVASFALYFYPFKKICYDAIFAGMGVFVTLMTSYIALFIWKGILSNLAAFVVIPGIITFFIIVIGLILTVVRIINPREIDDWIYMGLTSLLLICFSFLLCIGFYEAYDKSKSDNVVIEEVSEAEPNLYLYELYRINLTPGVVQGNNVLDGYIYKGIVDSKPVYFYCFKKVNDELILLHVPADEDVTSIYTLAEEQGAHLKVINNYEVITDNNQDPPTVEKRFVKTTYEFYLPTNNVLVME